MNYDFTTLRPRIAVGSSKWGAMQKLRQGLPPEVIPLSVADMEFVNPPEIAEHLSHYLETMILGYTQPTDSYYAALSDWMARRHNWKIDREWVVPSPGVVPALCHMVQAYTEPGDKVIVFPPVYYPFYSAIRENGRQVLECPLLEKDGHYEMDFDRFAQVAEEGIPLLKSIAFSQTERDAFQPGGVNSFRRPEM